ncbi:inositol hexakisphosphate and diphosphoinositol-pentakisphosphate kinase [Neophaeococcomyces mojaviensis]|uniref:Inositol hexakisphosphate and diphosphoinositol-pentakisphosphate kinase n=1 Tax=Neophaeococcomyces mojaviensis TaxID=3383035 RepID=A0ACC3A795_9EURO|nr:inositol hexakisphosphate and diphosphoinositol-pentakisphosphate kinase [Knufia sp. JES_112]
MDNSLRKVPTNGSVDNDKTDGGPLTPVFSNSSSSGTTHKPVESRNNKRTIPTHSLLTPANGVDVRKGPQIETTKAATNRASISMPPPLGKPSTDRRLSASVVTARLPRRSEDGVVAGSPPTSVKSIDDRLHFATSPPVSTTATDTTSITTGFVSHLPGPSVLSPPLPSIMPADSTLLALPNAQTESSSGNASRTSASPGKDAVTGNPSLLTQMKMDGVASDSALPARAPRNPTSRSASNTRRLSRTASKDNSVDENRPVIGRVGVCALDVKARSRPSRQILTRLQDNEEFEVIIFGDKVIQDEDVENWPICDFLISFFSDGFPIDKAIKYAKLRKPFLVNDLQMQKILWDRRLCLMILDHLRVPTPKRLEVTRDGGPRLESAELAQHLKKISGISLTGAEDGTGGGVPRTQSVELLDDGDTLVIDGQTIRKPFVEKPVSGEDHNIVIYFPKSQDGGGARKLFRKVGNKSSEYVKDLIVPRSITEPENSYIYEQFLVVDNSEDVKAYTVGSQYCHAETRKSPVVDGLVKRNTHGKELRYVTKLSDTEKQIAARIAKGFGQRICGFDLLRAGSTSYVIDVNGWSFVKDNEEYYNDCARILKSMFSEWKFTKSEITSEDHSPAEPANEDLSKKNGVPHSHRNALKTIFKSPSMNKLHAGLHHARNHGHESGTSSPKANPLTVPLSSPPSIERGSSVPLPDPPRSVGAHEPFTKLPPPITSTEPVIDNIIAEEGEKTEEEPAPMPSSKHSWRLKGVVAVIRHADRTPKQKIKFTAHSSVFVDLLKGHHEEVLLKGEAALASVQAAVRTAIEDKSEDPEKLKNLANALNRKMGQADTKVQIKPMFKKRKVDEPAVLTPQQTIPEHEQPTPQFTEPSQAEGLTSSWNEKVTRVQTRSDSVSDNTFSRFAAKEEDLILDKMQLVMKWGGEPTHSARYQSQDLGASMRDDWKLLNRDVLNDVRLFTSSEKRVKTSAQIWAAAFLGQSDIQEDFIQVRKDLLDDSNAAKDVMDKVKKKLKHLLREGNSVPEQFAWPKDVPEPYIVMQNVVDLLKFHRKVMRHNFKKLRGSAVASLAAINGSDAKDGNISEQIDASTIQARWCTGEDAELFKERWEKLFKEFCDTEKADPSKVSELYDTMKYDALHNKPFLEWVFTPSQSIIDEINREEGLLSQTTSPEPEKVEESEPTAHHRDSNVSFTSNIGDKYSLSSKLGLRRKSVLAKAPPTPPLMSDEQGASYFKLFSGSGVSRSKQDKRLGRLRELYRYAKVLFDYIGPQEYGISDEEKLEIGLLTSLPLLREIVQDLEELQASSNSASFIYFTKESHIYTLLNCIMEGGVHTKIKRATIPELDYLSQICFELYEAKDSETSETAYSIRISISPGCHTVDPLDVSLDSKHAIGTAPRRSLTNHQDWKDVISTLKAKFNTVQLPKSFLAVNVSDKHEQEARRASEIAEGLKDTGISALSYGNAVDEATTPGIEELAAVKLT